MKALTYALDTIYWLRMRSPAKLSDTALQ